MMTRAEAAHYLGERWGEEIDANWIKVRRAKSGRVWIFLFNDAFGDADAIAVGGRDLSAEPWSDVSRAQFSDARQLLAATEKLDIEWTQFLLTDCEYTIEDIAKELAAV